MSKFLGHGGLDAYALGDHSIDRWLDRQDTGFRELPDDREFARLEVQPKPKRLSLIKRRLRSLIRKRRRYAYQSV